MGKKCVVTFCKSGYKSPKHNEEGKKEKISIFSVPNDQKTIEQWGKAIPRQDYILKKGDGVCEKHFVDEQIVRIRQVTDDHGNVMASEVLQKPYLKKGSVPTIFPNCPKYLTKDKKKRKSPKKRQSPKTRSATLDFSDKQIKKRKILEEISSNKSEIGDSCGSVDTGSVEPENNLIEEEKQKRDRLTLFSLVFTEKHIVKIPTAWQRRDSDDGDTPAIEFTQSTSRKIKDEIRFISSKQLVFYHDMQVHAEVLGLKLDLEKIGFTGKYVSSIQELERLIEMFDNVKVCSGCALPNSIAKVETSFAIEDISKCLRHLNCSLVLPKNSKCSCCISCKN